MRVAEVMTTEVVTVTTDTTLKEAARLMLERRVGGLPVVDSADRPVGILTEADFVSREAARGQRTRHRLLDLMLDRRQPEMATAELVGEAMTSELVVTQKDALVSAAAQVMIERAVKRLPVVDEAGHLVGVISRTDVLRVFARSDEEIKRDVEGMLGTVLLRDEVAAVTVSVIGGVVELTGDVDSRRDAVVLAGVVGRLNGVVRVDNHLTWQVDESRPGSPWAPYPQEGSEDLSLE